MLLRQSLFVKWGNTTSGPLAADERLDRMQRSFDPQIREDRRRRVMYRRDGTPVYVEGRSVALRGEQGQITGYLAINRDITERKRTEDALHEAQAELAHVTRLAAIGELTASLAHELSQPLAAIAANAAACVRWLDADQPDLEQARTSAQRIIRDAQRGREVIEQTRRLAKGSIAFSSSAGGL